MINHRLHIQHFSNINTVQIIFITDSFLKGCSEFSSNEIELCKMTSHFELLTQSFLQKFFFCELTS